MARGDGLPRKPRGAAAAGLGMLMEPTPDFRKHLTLSKQEVKEDIAAIKAGIEALRSSSSGGDSRGRSWSR